MPTGVVKWFDPKTQEGVIRRGRREYPVRGEDMEPIARVAGARVRFSIRRDGGVGRAVKVWLRRGTRVSPRQHRFGDLVGAGHPNEKGHRPLTHRSPDQEWSFEGHPTELARTWLDLLEAGDLHTALLFYAPDALLHTDDGTVEGRKDIEPVLADRHLVGIRPRNPQIVGENDVIKVSWEAGAEETPAASTRLRIAHGKIVEQWL
jgi:hypothetical protein